MTKFTGAVSYVSRLPPVSCPGVLDKRSVRCALHLLVLRAQPNPFCVAHLFKDRLQQGSEALSYLHKATYQWPRGQSVIGMIPMLDSHDPYHDPLIAL